MPSSEAELAGLEIIPIDEVADVNNSSAATNEAASPNSSL